MSAFNLGVAEAVNTKKHARDPFHVSPNPMDILFCNARHYPFCHIQDANIETSEHVFS